MKYTRLAQLRTPAAFREYAAAAGAALPLDDTLITGPQSPLAQPLAFAGGHIGNRFCILPMEGWDGTPDGRPTDLTRRRWERFGLSGAKLIWGGEAVAVQPEGRANPNQLLLNADTVADLAALRDTLVAAHQARFGRVDDLLVGLQLTHSGRFARPHGQRLEPRVLYRHPLLDRKFHLESAAALLSDDEIDALIERFVQSAVLAQQAGFQFVDIKHCHGYLGHEFLSAVDRPGRYGGSLDNRTRFLRAVTAGIRQAAPGLQVAVRLSAFDWLPFKPGPERTGIPEAYAGGYPYAFGGDGSGTGLDLTEVHAFLDLLATLDIRLVCVTAGSPYYNPHIQRPALFPPSDGYQPPEDPLVGVARQINVTAALRHAHPDLLFVGSGYSYLQEWLPSVAQAVIRQGLADAIGLGRMVLSYPDLPADVLAGAALQRKRLCRTFSDCTTAPRNGLVSGCYPLDDFYKQRPEYARLQALKPAKRDPEEPS
ncbi:MAG: NADH:flavin oxidoreductase [Anaerolineae bacterium]|nr:NADH:flavin oxidoreductase [Anaerolineae bacterium]